MGATTKLSATEAAEAMKYMSMAGWKTEEMLDGIEGIMAIAAASGEDLAITSDIVTDALSAFGLIAKDSAHFLDILAAASNNLNTAPKKYNKAVKDNNANSLQAIAARNAVEQLKNAQDALTKAQQGTTKAVVGQNLLMSDADGNVRSLDEIIRVLRTALGETNVELVDSEGNLKEFDTVLKEAAEHGANLTQIQKLQAAATIFGKQNISGMLAIINASQNDYDKLSNKVWKVQVSAWESGWTHSRAKVKMRLMFIRIWQRT